MDYKTLLTKYIALVGNCEGVTFVGHIGESYAGVKFTDEEIAALQAAEIESAEYRS